MDSTTWTHRVLDSAADLDPVPPALAPEEAQQWCNFTVLLPGTTPAGTAVRGGSVRREAPPGRVGTATAGRTPWSTNNPAAYRFEIAGDDRALRVKQFLYDWAFPALDHPALWESPTHAVAVDDHHVLWFGTDYMGHRGASARIARTTVELSVLRGGFTDAEILAVYRSLRPADDAAALAVAATPFSRLGYWARRADATVIAVPLGLWAIRQPDGERPTWVAARDAADVERAYGLPPALAGLALDSAATGPAGAAVAAEAVYAGGFRRNRELRLHVYSGDGSAPAVEREAHPGRDETLSRHGSRVHLAWIDDRYGPFDAVVADDSGRPVLRLLSGTGVGCDRAWFLDAVDRLLTEPVRQPG